MIRVEGLTKFYGAIPGIDDVSFQVNKGEILGFLGPNGAGKSTTVRILTGYMPPTSGSAWVEEINVTEQPLEVQKHIGYLPENNPLYHDMTVASYLDFVAAVKGLSGPAKSDAVGRVVGGCGLENVAHRLIGHLSKGYRQRVGLAQALVNDPPVLILDEPTSGLDPAQIVEIRNLIRGLKGSRTIILSTHILPEVNMLCDRVVIIHRGRVAAEGGLGSLASNMEKETIIRISAFGTPDSLEREIARVGGVKKVMVKEADGADHARLEIHAEKGKEIRPDLAAAVIAAGGRLTELYQESITLEDLFVRVVSGDRREKENVHA